MWREGCGRAAHTVTHTLISGGAHIAPEIKNRRGPPSSAVPQHVAENEPMVLSLGLPLDQRGVSPRRPPMSPASKENANPVRNASPAGFVLSSNLRGAELPASTQLKNVEEMEKSVAGFNEFVAAAEVGDVRKVRDLLRRGADINKPDGDGWTALIAAAAEGHLEVVKMLLDTATWTSTWRTRTTRAP